MRVATLTLALLGLLFVGATYAADQQRAAIVPAGPHVAIVTDGAVVTPARRYVYESAPGWYRYYYSYPPYSTYRPRYYWYALPRVDEDGVVPYSGYYVPNGFNFQFNGPRRSFGFGF
jgi:hypothetical protein